MIKPSLCPRVIVIAVAITAACSGRPTYSPTPKNVAERMLELAEVTANDVVYDLGSGDGRIPIAAAKQYGARSVGIDISPVLVKIARAKALEAGVADRVKFEVGDVLKSDFRAATVVTLFLSTKFNAKLRPVLEQQLKPGTRIVSHDHTIAGWEPEVSAVRVDASLEIDSETLSSRPGKLIHMEIHSEQPREPQPDYMISADAPHWHTIYLWQIE